MHLQTITQHFRAPRHVSRNKIQPLTFEGLDHAFPHNRETERDVVFMGAHLTQKLKLQVIQGLKAQQTCKTVRFKCKHHCLSMELHILTQKDCIYWSCKQMFVSNCNVLPSTYFQVVFIKLFLCNSCFIRYYVYTCTCGWQIHKYLWMSRILLPCQ